MNLENRVVLVTGASRNLGRFIAIECAREGADVVVNFAKSEVEAEEVASEIRSLGRRSRAIGARVESYAEVEAMVKQVIDEFGRIDVLVNNAGILIRSLLMMMEPSDFSAVVNTNLVGTYHCIKAVSRHMIKARKGSIINISSLAGLRGLVGQGAYSASKGGVNSLTGVAAKELARYGIRVNGVAPGAIDTGMMTVFPEETHQKYLQSIPLARYGLPEEVARVVTFLASDASSYITGQTLTADGGMNC